MRNGLLWAVTPILPVWIKRAKTKAIFLTLLALIMGCASQVAKAQCYTFTAGTTATLTLNITNLPTPSTASDGAGGTIYTYHLAGLSGNGATLVSGSTNDTATSFSTFTISVDANPTLTTVQVAVIAPSPVFSANVILSNTTSDLLPSGWPATLPPIGSWNAATLYGVIGSSTPYSGTITLITAACSATGASPKAQGAACNCPGSPAAGEPITLSTGNLFEQATDYTTAGQNKLSLARYYNSQAANVSTYASTLGGIWRHNYDRYLRISPATGTATSVIAERADGQQLAFNWSGSAWVTDTDVDYTLTQSGTTWTLTDHDDTVETYTSASGKGTLNSIKLRNQYTQTLTYSSGLLQTVTDSYSRSLGFTYTSGLLSKVTTPDSATTGITYGFTGGVLTTVTYPTATATTLTYLYENTSSPMQLTGITDENGNRYATWAYDTQGRATSSKLGGTLGAGLTTVTYNTDGTVTSTNALGVADKYTFTLLQGVQKMTGISRASTATTAAATESFAYDTNGYTNSVTDWNSNQTTYVNNAHGQPTTINEAVGSTVVRTTTIVYDTTWVHLPYTVTAPQITTTFTYDPHGSPLTKQEKDTGTQTVPYSTNAVTRTWTNTYNATGQLLTVTGPRTDVTQETQYGYDGSGALTSVTDALTHLTTINTHTGGGLPTKITDPNSVVTNLTYDGRQRLLTSVLVTGAGNLTTTYLYDSAGNLTKTTLPDSSYLSNTWDKAHRLTRIANALGEYINYTLNALGDRTASNIYTSGGTLKRGHTATFDALGRILTDVGGMSQTTTYAYDANGNALTVTDPKSHIAHQTFDALNRLSTHTDANSGVTTTTYDAHDRVLSVKDPNLHTTSYVRDGFGRVIQIASPDSGTTVNHYDLAGNMTSKTDGASVVINHTYDKLNREVTRTFPGDTAENVSKTYDQSGTISGFTYGLGVGRLTSLTDQVGSLKTRYDERGNVLHDMRNAPTGSTWELDTYYAFDGANRIQSYKNPDGYSVVYTRDATGQVTGIGTEAPGVTTPTAAISSVTHLPFGPVASFNYANGVNRTTTYDADYRQTFLKDQGTAAIQNLTYAFDADDNVSSITDAVNADNTQAMTYDSLDRLLSATTSPSASGYGAYSYTYDANGNMLTQTQGSGVGSMFSYANYTGTNQLEAITCPGEGGMARAARRVRPEISQPRRGAVKPLITGLGCQPTTYAYNNAGARTTETNDGYLGLTNSYDQSERLHTATYTSMPTSTDAYDADGTMVTKSAYAFFLYAHNRRSGLLIHEENLTPTASDYIYLDPDATSGSDAQPVALIANYPPVSGPNVTAVFYMHSDRLGTPMYVTDSSQTVQWGVTYQPFGQTWDITYGADNILQNLVFLGQYLEPDVYYYYNHQRHYDPIIGIYVQSDPIGLGAGTTNTYQYAGGNPFKWVDPSGENILVVVGGANGGPNIFGHTSIAVTGGGIYSFGTGTPLGSNLDSFLLQQSLSRDQYLYNIPTTADQDQAALNYLSSQKDDIGKLDNCAARTYNALKTAGVTVPSLSNNGYGAIPANINYLMQQLTNAGGATETIIPMGATVNGSFSSFNLDLPR